ncbi:hypothetical protein GGI25_003994 [Coemansia spiralis]|uniref:Uncharacterized protein n=2 Tax=Coemansia TaxID=4863 RepID=A0A9W8G7I7_9FUNG|nr:hypothetical protein BX070DRAFT_134934 [Coemansia spiralis]KAJ1990742.1 hypothetical protein EDC05_003836 [Coemansia umbellata]KAJ2620914.1 hypothetical protein GGI26_004613 [Coemansia sp. RSA 1358]KAJ2675486.1 hypothetical protein GGI25_003994 [Coemansia spiralis]
MASSLGLQKHPLPHHLSQCGYLSRQDSQLSIRYVYTHSECSSSISSLSTISSKSSSLGTFYNTGRALSTALGRSFYARNTRSIGLPDNVSRVLSLVSAYMVVALSAGLCSIYGIFESDYEVVFAQDDSSTPVRSRFAMLIGALQLSFFVAFKRAPVSRWMGSIRAAILLGAVLSAGGLLSASYARAIWQLCLTQGIAVGAGCAISCGAAMHTVDVLKQGRRLVGMERFTKEVISRVWLSHSMPTIFFAGAAGFGGSVLALGVQRLIYAVGDTFALRWLSLVVGVSQLFAVVFISTPSQLAQQSATELVALDVTAGQIEKDVDSPVLKDRRDTINSRQARLKKVRGEKLRFGFGLLGGCCYHMCYMVPAILMPGYANTILPNNKAYSGAGLLALICFASAVGSLLGNLFASMRHIHFSKIQQSTVQCVLLVALSLSIWCLWLPTANSWGMASAFCTVYGMLWGLVQEVGGYAQMSFVTNTVDLARVFLRPQQTKDSMAKAAADDLYTKSEQENNRDWNSATMDYSRVGSRSGALLATITSVFWAASALVSVSISEWLFVRVGAGETYLPSIAFTAAASTMAAILTAISTYLVAH